MKHWKVVAAINDRVRVRERYQTYPEDPSRVCCVTWYRWNIQDDREAFGFMRGHSIGGGPLQMVEWKDGRTLWDELRVLQFVFGEADD
jgi:hypothetical protein